MLGLRLDFRVGLNVRVRVVGLRLRLGLWFNTVGVADLRTWG